jgi:hypothetical protein
MHAISAHHSKRVLKLSGVTSCTAAEQRMQHAQQSSTAAGSNSGSSSSTSTSAVSPAWSADAVLQAVKYYPHYNSSLYACPLAVSGEYGSAAVSRWIGLGWPSCCARKPQHCSKSICKASNIALGLILFQPFVGSACARPVRVSLVHVGSSWQNWCHCIEDLMLVSVDEVV